MAFLKTSYNDHDSLFVGVRDFARAQGWSLVYDSLTDKFQMGLSKGNCHISIGLQRNSNDTSYNSRFDVTNAITGTKELDRRMCLSLATSNAMNLTRYWGNPGQLPSDGDDVRDTAYINDLVGPFPNVWFFSDANGNYIHVVVQRTASRYFSFTFGNLDIKGMTVPACGYAGGDYFNWWPNDSRVNYSGCYVNNWETGPHYSYISSIGNFYSFQAMIPAGVLNSAYAWPTQPFVTMSFLRPLQPCVERSTAINIAYYELLNHIRITGNQTTTGGIPLHAIPIIYKQSSTQQCWLGELPDIRLVNIENLSPEQEISYGGDTWVVFPWKQKGRFENSYEGNSPTADPNSWYYGIAIRKIV